MFLLLSFDIYTGISIYSLFLSQTHVVQLVSCRDQITHIFVALRKLIESIEALGCKIPDDFIVCRSCGEAGISGGFAVPSSTNQAYKPQIVICDDKGLKKKQVAQTLVHELVHAYDFCKTKIEASSCIHRACTEIRASSLSEECNLPSELMRG